MLLCNAGSLQESPEITSDMRGGGIVVWKDTRNSIVQAYAQRINAGLVKWAQGAVRLCPGSDAYQLNAKIVSDGQYGAIVTWEDWRPGANQDIYAQRVSDDAPTVNLIYPSSGFNNGQQACQINGVNFVGPGTHAKLRMGSGSYVYGTGTVVANEQTLTCTFPLNGLPHGKYDVWVFSDNGQSGKLVEGFTVRSATPVIESVVPGDVQPGDLVTVTGGGFGDTQGAGAGLTGGAASYVSFGGVSATEYTSWADTQIVCQVPVGASSGGVTVTTGAGTSNASNITVVYPTWYLAEGTTAWGFDTSIAIENPNGSAVNAQVTFMTGSGEVDGGTMSLPAKSQTTLMNDYLVGLLGEQDFSTRVQCLDATKNICADRTMTWYSGYGNGNAWHASVGVTGQATTWYLPEGSSNWGFQTWLLIQNPNPTQATCQVTYMIENEGPQTVTHTVPANSRQTYNMADDIGSKDASIMVQADVGVIPERAMYQMSTGQYAVPGSRREGHDSIGTTQPAPDYFLAEGTSAWGFTTYVLVQNPNAVPANVDVTYMTGSGPQPQAQFQMSANSRKTIRVNEVPGMGNIDFSTQVHADQPIIAERAMYWQPGTPDSNQAMHDSIGMSAPHTTFYLPDGETFVTDEGPYTIETFTLVQNPNNVPVEIELSYLPESGGSLVTWNDTVPANSRMTFNMRDRIQADARAAIKVECLTAGRKIMVERSMYMQDRWGGTDTIGGYSD